MALSLETDRHITTITTLPSISCTLPHNVWLFATQPHWPPLSFPFYLNEISRFYQSFKEGGWQPSQKVGVSGGGKVRWSESSAMVDCEGGQLVLLTRDQYCPPSGWSQAAGSDRGPCGVIGSGGPASRLPAPPSALSQLSHVILLRCCHPRRLAGLSYSPLPHRTHANVHLADECWQY